MSSKELVNVLKTLDREISEAIKLVSRIQQICQSRTVRPRISKKHFEMIVELAFLRSFLAWESFLEDSCILYLMGKKSPKGYTPKRYVMPKNLNHALDFTSAEARYADWTVADAVIKRAERFFKDGEPYSSALKIRNSRFNDLKTLRNAITHSSSQARDKFKALVRRELTYYPNGLAPGGFLLKGLPNLTSRSFLEEYLDVFTQAAKEIVH
jgi:hypothetical protein